MFARMQTIDETGAISSRVDALLAHAERSAERAVRTMRALLASAPSGSVGPLIDDVDQLFSLIDAADLRCELARTTASVEDAIEYAEEARSLADAAHDEALRRAGKGAGRTSPSGHAQLRLVGC